MSNKFYITTAIDYTNDVIHVGHSYQKILADALARYHRAIGDETYFLTGTDEHGQKVQKSAEEEGLNPKKFVDTIAKEDIFEWKKLNISYDRFIRTTDKDHIKTAQEFYLKSKKNGDIYLSKYEGLYCEGCEAYITSSDLVEGKCPFHPTKKPQKIKEENYFFALSKYQNFLEKLVSNDKQFVIPESKRIEIICFIKNGLQDFSVSRQNVSWGIPVPDDPKHTIYVWFDALINYYTYGLERDCWPADIHVLGKDNQKFHAIYWPAMLKSVGLPLPKTILVHDFFSLDGQKISKSLGNVIRPSELVDKYKTDGVRYYFLRYGPLRNDVDITFEKINTAYESDLSNGLGNLASRLATLCEKYEVGSVSFKQSFDEQVEKHIKFFRVTEAIDAIWKKISQVDQALSIDKPWLGKNPKKDKESVARNTSNLLEIAYNLQPFLPDTSDIILKHFSGNKITRLEPLFPRLK